MIDAVDALWKNVRMVIGIRLKKLREERSLSQGDIEKRTGLLRCYISRVENGHTVPSLETLERLAAALEIPLHQLFYEGDGEPALPNLSKRQSTEELVLDAEQEKEMRFFEKVKRLLARIDEKDRQLLLYMAQKLASR
jgi:transcriptional regulator with XRE-family HTH domain